MKKPLISSYVSGIKDRTSGESYTTIFGYFLPELITGLVLYSLLYLLDAWFIGHLKSTSAYATLGVANTLLHFLVKVSEGFSVGTLILCGTFNGVGDYERVGKVFRDSFWTNMIVGFFLAGSLYLGAYWIYVLYGVPADMMAIGIPFLRLRAISVFLMFIYFSFVGFLRGIKDTKTPMYIFLIGGACFIFFDYALIFGAWGFPELRLQGSAWASIIQYSVMNVVALAALLLSPEKRKYGVTLFTGIADMTYIKELFVLSWPVILDKATMAAAYIWLGSRIAPMGKCALATFTVVKDFERLAILPAAAFAQVITFMVSNDLGKKKWDAIKSNTKKTIFLSSIMVLSILILFSFFPKVFIRLFDKKGEFIGLAAQVFPLLAILAFFDVLQLVLSGALRGAANVKVVMWVRLLICGGFFVPISYVISQMEIQDEVVKFIVVYGSFYVGNALMSIAYIYRFRTEQWKHLL